MYAVIIICIVSFVMFAEMIHSISKSNKRKRNINLEGDK